MLTTSGSGFDSCNGRSDRGVGSHGGIGSGDADGAGDVNLRCQVDEGTFNVGEVE